MAGNFGIGLGAFMQGLNGGMAMGKQIKGAFDEAEIRDATKAGMDQARTARDADIQQHMDGLMGIGAPPGAQQPDPASGPNGTPAQSPDVQAQPVPMDNPQASPLGGIGVPPGAAPAQQAPTLPKQQPQASTLPQQQPPQAPAASLAPGEQVMDPAQVLNQKLAGAQQPQAAGLAGQAPMSADQARGLAEKKVGSVLDYFNKNAAPMIAQKYLEQGNTQMAQAWTEYAGTQEMQSNMRTWSKMWRASQLGDLQGMADHAMDLYNKLDDGAQASDPRAVKDNDGNITGFNVSLTTPDGQKRDSFIGKDQMMDMGISALSPPAMFEKVYARDQAREKAQADAATTLGKLKVENAYKEASDVRREGREEARDNRKADREADRDVRQSDLRRGEKRSEVQDKIDIQKQALADSGFSKEEIDSYMPALLNVGEFKKKTSPEETTRLLVTELAKDPLFVKKSPEDQKKIIDKLTSHITDNTPTKKGDSNAITSKTDNPFTPDPASPAAVAKGGLYFRNKKTGEIVQR